VSHFEELTKQLLTCLFASFSMAVILKTKQLPTYIFYFKDSISSPQPKVSWRLTGKPFPRIELKGFTESNRLAHYAKLLVTHFKSFMMSAIGGAPKTPDHHPAAAFSLFRIYPRKS
jgi:hypothetical protein